MGTALKNFNKPDSENNASSGLITNKTINAAKGFNAKNITTAGNSIKASL